MSSYNHDDSFRHDRDSDAMWADFHDTARSERNDDDLVLFPGDRDELIAQVGAALREKFGKQIFIDSDGDYVLNHLGQSIWVRVHADAPVIMVFARVAQRCVLAARDRGGTRDPQPQDGALQVVPRRARRVPGGRNARYSVCAAPLVGTSR